MAVPQKALAFLFVTVLVDTIGLGIVIPVTPELIMELTGEGLSEAASYGGWLLFVYALMQFICAPIIGNLSDRFGRRPVLLLSLFAFGLNFTLMGLAPTLGWLFLGRSLAGIAGASSTTANAYVADVSSPDQRAQNFGMMGAAWGLGFIIGPVLGGFLGQYGSRVPFFAAAGLALANVLYGFFVLPESLPHKDRRPFSIRRANPVGALFQMRRYPGFVGLFGVLVLFRLAQDANPSTWTYFTMLKFDWSELEVGLSMGAVGVVTFFVQAGLIRVAISRLGEQRAVVVGLLLMAFGFAGFAFSVAGWMIYAFIVPFCLGTIASPALRSILSSRVGPEVQGELQGAIASVVSLTAILAPPVMTQLFRYFTAIGTPLYFPGATFLAGSILLVVSLGLFLRTAQG